MYCRAPTHNPICILELLPLSRHRPGFSPGVTHGVSEDDSTFAVWGLLPGAQPHLFAKNCSISKALDEVTMTTNYAYSFVTIVSLGFWAPMDIEWRCAKTTLPEINEPL